MGLQLKEYQKSSAAYRFQQAVYDHLEPNGTDLKPTFWLASVAGINVGTAMNLTRQSSSLKNVGTGKSNGASDVARLFAPSSKSCRLCVLIQPKSKLGCVMFDEVVGASTARYGYKAFLSQRGEITQGEEH